MDKLTRTVDVAAPAAVIWALWSDLEASPAWDTDVASCQLNGLFAPGTLGLCKLKNGLQMTIVLEEVIIGQRWSNAARLLGANLRFHHWLEEVSPGQCRVTHQADVSLISPWLWRRIVQALLRPSLTKSLNNLAQLAVHRAREPQCTQ